MKSLLLSLSFFPIILCRSFAQPATVQTLSGIFTEQSPDSVRYIERLAAMKFHKMLNDYRAEKGRHALLWNETLWLASHNHNLWMDENRKLSHNQKTGTKYFTGTEPGQRYAYAAGGQAPYKWSGENALYHFHSDGKSAEEIAHNIAEQSLKQWIQSPGHHENLLAEKHAMHGTAFLLNSSGKVWATDLFASCGICPADEYTADPLVFNFKSDNRSVPAPAAQNDRAGQSPATASGKPHRFNAYRATLESLHRIYAEYDLKRHKAMEKAASEHAEYLAAAKNPGSVENPDSPRFYGKTPYSRVMKASAGMFLFLKGNRKLKEDFVILEAELNNLDMNKLLGEALERMEAVSDDRTRMGVGVTLKRKKDKVKLVVVRLTC